MTSQVVLSLRVQLLRLLRIQWDLGAIRSWSLWIQLIAISQIHSVQQTSHSLCQSRISSQSQAVVQLLQVELSVVFFMLMRKLRSLVSMRIRRRQLLPVSRCSVSFLMRLRLVIISVLFFVVSREQKSREDRFSLSRVL